MDQQIMILFFNMWQKKYNNKQKGKIMDEIDKYRSEMNKKHYPIYWKIEDNQIKITDINNKELPKDHEVYQAELSFIQDKISEMEFSGEIVMM